LTTLQRCLQGKFEEETVRAGLNPNATHHLVLGTTRLVLQEEVMFEQGIVWEDGKIGIVEMNKNCDLEDGVWIQMS
jgi:hypothetical protein